MKNFDRNNIKIDERSRKNVPIYCIGYVMIKDLKYAKTNSVNPVCFIFSKVTKYFEKVNKISI